MSRLGDRLKRKRKEAKLTQKDVAKRLGIDHTTVSKWESGIYEPDAETLKVIAEMYNVNGNYLLGLTEEKSVTKNEALEIYNRLPQDKKKLVDDMIKALGQQQQP